MSATLTTVQNFVQICPWGISGQIGKIHLFIHFLRNSITYKSDCSTDFRKAISADSHRDVLLGGLLLLLPIYGVKCQKHNFRGKGREYNVFKPNAPILKLAYYQNYCIYGNQ